MMGICGAHGDLGFVPNFTALGIIGTASTDRFIRVFYPPERMEVPYKVEAVPAMMFSSHTSREYQEDNKEEGSILLPELEEVS